MDKILVIIGSESRSVDTWLAPILLKLCDLPAGPWLVMTWQRITIHNKGKAPTRIEVTVGD